MNRNNLLFTLIILLTVSCGSKSSQDSANSQHNAVQSESKVAGKAENAFDINSIPVSNAEIGIFPYLSAPEGYQYSNEHNKRYEKKYFFYNNSSVMTIEGKYYHARVYPIEGEVFSDSYIVKNYEQTIKELGGVEIYSGGIVRNASDLLKKNDMAYVKDMYDPYPYNYKHFVLRTPDGNIWIELCHGFNANIIDFTIVYDE